MDTTEKTRLRHEVLLADHIENLRYDFGMYAEYCQSPIETALLLELQWCSGDFTSVPNFMFLPKEIEKDRIWRALSAPQIGIIPQAQWQNYRIDIAVLTPGANGGRLKVAIECDGHDFHEKTKEQASRDKSRDRDLTLGGWVPMHFTGSEIYKDAAKCAAQVFKFINSWAQDEISQLYDSKKKAL